MRLANIIVAHKNPSQLERLIRKLSHPGSDFYIHIDKKIDIQAFSYLENMSGVFFIKNRMVCNWGGFSTLEAMTGSLAEVMDTRKEYDFYNLLSAQDYPLKSNEAINTYFASHKEKSFIFYESEHADAWWKGAVNRFQRYHLTDFNFRGKATVERWINMVMPARKFPLPWKLYGGSKSSWWSLNPPTAKYLVDFFAKELTIGKFLRFCWGTDEFVIPSILMNSPYKDTIVNNNLRYIDFSAGGGNPKVLDVNDFEALMGSGMLFGRKFDTTVCEEILDKIDLHTQSPA